MGVCDKHGTGQTVPKEEVVGGYSPVPKDPFHLNLIWILLRLWVKFVLGGGSLIIGMVVGVLLVLYHIPFWVPVPLLVGAIVTRRFYFSVFLLGLLLPLLGEVIH